MYLDYSQSNDINTQLIELMTNSMVKQSEDILMMADLCTQMEIKNCGLEQLHRMEKYQVKQIDHLNTG